MAVPDFQTLMLPVLREFADGNGKSPADIRDPIASQFALARKDLDMMLPSGTQSTFTNRVAWALAYLKQADLLQSTRRARYALTDRGRDVLRSPPSRIDIAFLQQYPTFQAFRSRRDSKIEVPVTSVTPDPTVSTTTPVLTPDEQIRIGYELLRSNLAAQLLDRVRQATPVSFEELVVMLLVAMGYGGSYADGRG